MNDGNLTAMQKGLAGKFTMSDVEMMIETAKKSYKVQAEYFKKL
jgi:exosome complex RNA-binding protein Rrp42 (RNase PH superfamily)